MNTTPDNLLSNGRERLDWIVGFMCLNYQFIYRVLGDMTRTPTPGFGKEPGEATGTMGVAVQSGAVQLKYDPAFAMGLRDPELVYVLYHEVMHVVLHHCTARDFDDREIGNIAHDLAVNEIIPVVERHCEPPRDKDGKLLGCYVNEFKKNKAFVDMENNQTAEYYYEYLMKRKQALQKDIKRFDCHEEHAEDEIAAERIRALVNEIHSRNLWGDLSNGVQEIILAAQTRKINWRKEIRQIYGNISWPEKYATRKRPNRRTGLIHPGYRRIQVDRHLVVADTSGSIDSGLLAQWLSIVNQISEQMPVDFMQVDCEKQTEPRPFDRRVKELAFLGRGGTDFEPIIQTVNERGYRSVMILTDGEAAAVKAPEHAQVVWVLPKGHNPPVDWGKRIHMDKYV